MNPGAAVGENELLDEYQDWKTWYIIQRTAAKNGMVR